MKTLVWVEHDNAHVADAKLAAVTAAGKLGAVCGAALFKPLAAAASVRATLLACAAISLLGALVTAAFVINDREQRVVV